MKNVNYEMNATKSNLHPKLWKRDFQVLRAFVKINRITLSKGQIMVL